MLLGVYSTFERDKFIGIAVCYLQQLEELACLICFVSNTNSLVGAFVFLTVILGVVNAMRNFVIIVRGGNLVFLLDFVLS